MTASQFFIQSPRLHCPPFKQIKQWKKMMIATGAKRLWIAAFLFIQMEWQWIWSQMRAFTVRMFEMFHTFVCACVWFERVFGFPLFQTVCFHFVVHPHLFIYKQKPWQHVSPDMFSWLHLSPSKLNGVIFAFREKKRRKSEKTYMTVRLPAESVASVQWGQLCNQKHKATVSDGMQMIRSS